MRSASASVLFTRSLMTSCCHVHACLYGIKPGNLYNCIRLLIADCIDAIFRKVTSCILDILEKSISAFVLLTEILGEVVYFASLTVDVYLTAVSTVSYYYYDFHVIFQLDVQ